MKGNVSSDCFVFCCEEINLRVTEMLQYQHRVTSTAFANAVYKYGLHVFNKMPRYGLNT